MFIFSLKITISRKLRKFSISILPLCYRYQLGEYLVLSIESMNLDLINPVARASSTWLRYSHLCSELFEREYNIISRDWTLLSGQHCRASMVLHSRKMRKRIDSDCEFSLSFFSLFSLFHSLDKRGSEIVCRSRVFAIFQASEGASERSPNSLRHTRWACKPCSRLDTLDKHSCTCRAAACTGCPDSRALSFIHTCATRPI